METLKSATCKLPPHQPTSCFFFFFFNGERSQKHTNRCVKTRRTDVHFGREFCVGRDTERHDLVGYPFSNRQERSSRKCTWFDHYSRIKEIRKGTKTSEAPEASRVGCSRKSACAGGVATRNELQAAKSTISQDNTNDNRREHEEMGYMVFGDG